MDVRVIIIPAKDEERSVAAVVGDFRREAADLDGDTRIVVVDDQSSDHTCAVARKAGALVVRTPSPGGLGATFRFGVETALALGCDEIVHVDGDGQYAATDLARLVAARKSGSDLVVGDRLWRRPAGMTRRRYLENLAASRVISMITGVRVGDAQSGFRVFGRDVACAFVVTGTFTYTQEQLIRAAAAGFRLTFVPIAFGRRRFGTSRLVSSTSYYIRRAVPEILAVVFATGQKNSTRFPG